MVDRGHTFMKTEEGYEEYQNYYDFTRVFEEQLKQQGKVVPGIQFVKVKVIVPPGKELMDKVEADNEKEEGGEEDEDEWEDEEDEEELGEAS